MRDLTRDITKYASELEDELREILRFWTINTPDEQNGGFVGKIDNDNTIDYNAPKGAVLNSRILWTFSAAWNLTREQGYLDMARRACKYLTAYFLDKEFGGVYWTVDAAGNPLDTKKQVYACAFAIYALSEYYKASSDQEALALAIDMYHVLVHYSYDEERSGYFEAFSRNWGPIDDLRLSAKDANEKKTMNTHLHLLEAYTNLYRVWKDEGLRMEIAKLIGNFSSFMIDKDTWHLILFLDEHWVRKSEDISYGHDIEASWLLLEAAEVIDDEVLIAQMKQNAIKMASASEEGLDKDGGLWYEFTPSTMHVVKEKHWWVQAEAMVGFFNAWQVSGEERFLQASLSNWQFVKANIIDRKNGEWFWGVGGNGEVMSKEDKVGLWKCPYHNSRACIEIISRVRVLAK